MTRSSLYIRKLVCSALCLALAMLLPLLTGQIPEIGSMLSPMHIPVFLCGFACGWPWGLAVGFVAPFLRYAIFSMPPMPFGIAMAFELAAYGLLSGALYRALPRKNASIYVSLIVSMLGGRIVWGIASYIIAGLQNSEFPFSAFLAGAFIEAVPGIILHIVLIPLVVMALKKASLIFDA